MQDLWKFMGKGKGKQKKNWDIGKGRDSKEEVETGVPQVIWIRPLQIDRSGIRGWMGEDVMGALQLGLA